MNLNIALGARILVRSEEWLVRTAESSADGGHLIICEGISELVRGTEAHFLTQLEGDNSIQVLDPADIATGYIYCFFIDQRYQRNGYGTAALQYVLDKLCGEQGCTKVQLSYMHFAWDTAICPSITRMVSGTFCRIRH